MAEIDKNCVEGNCFAINDKSQGSGNTTLNIVYKANYTGQICTAKFRIRSKDGSIVKEYMIAQEAKPVFYNIKMVQAFTKDDCLANQHGSVVIYTVPERKYSSFISQEDADAKALEDININGQAYANAVGECITDIWYNVEMSETFYRNNCDEFCDGSAYVYTVPEGKYVSSISQEDADAKARADIEANGQLQANLEGHCVEKPGIFYGKFSHTFTRNNCDSTQYGTEVVVDETMVDGDFRSLESQDAANKLAEAAVMEQGQDIANIKGSCEKIPVYTGSYSKIFQRTNCPAGSTPVNFTVTERMCEGYPFQSTVSQEEANKLAQEAVEAQGQDITNEQGDCQTNLYYNVRMEKTVNRNDCDQFSDGQPYTYVVAAGKYSSTISQDDADAKAEADLEENAQIQANLNGECKPKENIYYGHYSEEFTRNNCDETQYGTKVMVDETMVEGDFRSIESQEAADALAEAAVKAQGQDIANIKGSCEKTPVFTGTAQKEFTRDDCPEGGEPGTYVVTDKMCDGYPFTSTVDQEDANAKAQAAVDEQGQAIANANATCTFTGHASMDFTKNDCDTSHNGSVVTVTETDVTGGPFLSTESQQAADMLASIAVQAQGQDVANAKGECIEKTSYIGKASFEFTKNDCGENQTGKPFIVTQDMVEGNPFVSYVSQEEANLLAMAAVMSQGQAVANERGECQEAQKYTGHYTGVFEKDDCEEGLIPSSVSVTEADVEGGPFYSYESQFAADELAKAAVMEQGQAIANAKGTCNEMKVYFGNYSREFTPTCPECQYGDPVTLTPEIMGQVFTSVNSQTEADALAKAYVDRMGQAFADKNYAQTCHTIEEQPEWETREEACRDCISQLHQYNINECYTGELQEQWIPGGTTTCFWFGVASGQFTKQCADGGVGSLETVTQDELTDPDPQEGGKFKSCISQEDANAKAEAALAEQGQAIANTKGTCTWQGHFEGQVQKNDCADGGVGDMVTVNSDNLSGYPYESNISLDDANSQAENDVRGQVGQEYANKNGGCTWTYEATRTFYRDNCDETGVPQPIEVTSTQANGGEAVTSKVSLADAMDQAERILDENGQDYANEHGLCLYTGDASISLPKSDCGTCMHSSGNVTVYYSYLGLSDITSNVSQADANQQALNALNGSSRYHSQAYANKNGSCAADSTSPTWSYGTWSYGCNGNYRTRSRRVTQTNPCSTEDSYTETDNTYQYCENGCRGGECITCDDTLQYDSPTCRNGVSQRHVWNECGYSTYENYGEACCNTNSFPTTTVNKTCQENYCASEKDVEVTGIGYGTMCYETTDKANSMAEQEFNRRKQAVLDSITCNPGYFNTSFKIDAYATNCPSSCTAKRLQYTIPSNWWFSCISVADANEKIEADFTSRGVHTEWANEQAESTRCDCPEVGGTIEFRLGSADGNCIWGGDGTISGYGGGTSINGCFGSVIGRMSNVPAGTYGQFEGTGCVGESSSNCSPGVRFSGYVGTVSAGQTKTVSLYIE